jgi:hypothetical protein
MEESGVLRDGSDALESDATALAEGNFAYVVKFLSLEATHR